MSGASLRCATDLALAANRIMKSIHKLGRYSSPRLKLHGAAPYTLQSPGKNWPIEKNALPFSRPMKLLGARNAGFHS